MNGTLFRVRSFYVVKRIENQIDLTAQNFSYSGHWHLQSPGKRRVTAITLKAVLFCCYVSTFSTIFGHGNEIEGLIAWSVRFSQVFVFLNYGTQWLGHSGLVRLSAVLTLPFTRSWHIPDRTSIADMCLLVGKQFQFISGLFTLWPWFCGRRSHTPLAWCSIYTRIDRDLVSLVENYIFR